MTTLHAADAATEKWMRQAYKMAKASPGLAQRLEPLEERLAVVRDRQREVIEHALDQRRTMHRTERELYDSFEPEIHRLETQIKLLLEKALQRPRSCPPSWRLL